MDKEKLVETLDRLLELDPGKFAKLVARKEIALGSNGQLEIDFEVYKQLTK